MTRSDPIPSPSDDPAEDPPLARLFTEIGIIHQLASAALERALPEGVSRAQFTMLMHLTRRGAAQSPHAMARALQVTKGAVTHTMGKLLEQGLIAIRPDPEDGRGKLVEVTPAGRAMRARCVARAAELFAPTAERFSAAEVAAARPFLERLRRHLDEEMR